MVLRMSPEGHAGLPIDLRSPVSVRMADIETVPSLASVKPGYKSPHVIGV
jgi:hypothetical protein